MSEADDFDAMMEAFGGSAQALAAEKKEEAPKEEGKVKDKAETNAPAE